MMTTRHTALAARRLCQRACRGLRVARRLPPAAEPPTLDVTHWTDKTELFMEYPPLVAGQTALLRRASDADWPTSAR